MGFLSKIDDRVHIPVMLDMALAARRPRFRLQHRIVEVEGLASPAIRGRQPGKWHPDFTPRDLVKQLLLYGCLPLRMIGLIAPFRFR